jgi:pimeloyl-ACP methyl ester carboxylesterase
VLNYSVLASEHHNKQLVFVCHGILGSGQNWRTFCRQLQEHRPDLELVLVDLRCHGHSPSVSPPHTVDACARDLLQLSGELGLPDAVIGHSFGGKVALSLMRYISPAEVWVLDSPPGPLSDKPEDRHEVSKVITALRAVPLPLSKRKDLKDLLMAAGFSSAIGTWMTTNLKRSPEGGLIWRFDLDGVESLIKDYFKEDLWSMIEDDYDTDVHLVRAQLSDRWSPEILARLNRQRESKVHVLPRSGHWVHVDNPTGLSEILHRFLLVDI